MSLQDELERVEAEAARLRREIAAGPCRDMSAGRADPDSSALLFASFYAALQGACSETERRDRIVMLDQALARIDGEGAYPALARAARRMVDTFEGRRESMVGASAWSSALVLVERELERIVGDFLKQALRKMEGAA